MLQWNEEVLRPLLRQTGKIHDRSETYGWIFATGGLRLTQSTFQNNQKIHDSAKTMAEMLGMVMLEFGWVVA